MTVECAGHNCKWRLHASVLPDEKTFMVKNLILEYTYIRIDYNKNSNASTAWVSEKLNEMLSVNPSMSYELMHNEMKKI